MIQNDSETFDEWAMYLLAKTYQIKRSMDGTLEAILAFVSFHAGHVIANHALCNPTFVSDLTVSNSQIE